MTDAELLKAMLENAFEQGHRVGFESAKAAAREIIEKHEMSTSRFGWTDFSDMISQVEALQPEVTR